MPSLKEVRVRISSVSTTQQITGAMKMVAASKLRKSQDSILKLRPYVYKMQDFLRNLASAVSSNNPFIHQVDAPEKVLIVVMTSNRGLCGAFNSNVNKAVLAYARETYPEHLKNETLHFISIGKRGGDYLVKNSFKLIERADELYNNLSFEKVLPMAQKLRELFVAGDYQRILLVYNRFKNAAVQELQIEQFLPLEVIASEENEFPTEYIYQPDKETVINELIPKFLNLQLYKAILDSFASEHGARMTAMHKATDNAQELLRDLRLSYNKARQAAITKEINEIVSGAEALKS